MGVGDIKAHEEGVLLILSCIRQEAENLEWDSCTGEGEGSWGGAPKTNFAKVPLTPDYVCIYD